MGRIKTYMLAFKNERDAYSSVCEAFFKYGSESATLKENYSFSQDRFTMDNLLMLIECGRLSKDTAIGKYITGIALYPIRHNIRSEMYKNEELYPRSSMQDFDNRYGEIIDKKKEEELIKVKQEINEFLFNKSYISIIDIPDRWPENCMLNICDLLNKRNVKLIWED